MTTALLLIAACALAIDAVVLWLVPDIRVRVRLRTSLDDMPATLTPSLPSFVRGIAGEAWRDDGDDLARCLGALRWTRDKVSAYGPETSSNPEDLLRDVEAGAPAICTGMTTLFRATLSAAGLASRTVMLQRNLFDAFDTHTLVEARIHGHWILVDPTFGVLAEGANGNLLSAQQVHALMLGGGAPSWRHVGGTRYPVQMGAYYIDIRYLFNNVFIEGAPTGAMVSRLPPFRYFIGPTRNYQSGAPLDSDHHLRVLSRLQVVFMIVLPLVAFGCATAVILGTFVTS